jgi:hypothetical protein
MSHNVYIGIDNGTTGTVGVVSATKAFMYRVPIIKEQSYTKKRQSISRVDVFKLSELLSSWSNSFVLIERPMINPGRFFASLSAIRCLEATLIVIDELDIPYQYCDSKEWQKVLLPRGTSKEDLKKMSLQIGKRLFPHIRWRRKFKDADGLLIAEWAKRMRF